MGGALLLAIALTGVTAWAGFAAAALRLDSALRVALAAYVLGWAGIVLVVVLLSVPGWLDRASVTTALCCLGIVGLVAWLARGRPPLPPVVPAARGALGDPLVAGFATAFVPAGLYLTALAFGTTPNDWDGLTYHETRALLWDAQRAIGYVAAGNDPRLNGNPPVAEIGLYVAMLVPRSERLAALPQYTALLASVGAVALAARRLGASRPEAAYGALVFASLPVVLLHGTGIQNDLVVAAFLLASVVFLLGRRPTEFALGALALGLALNTKFSAVFTLPLVIAVVAVARRSEDRGRALFAVAVGLVLGSSWYILNLAETGSVDGGLGETTGQSAVLTPAAVLGTVRALAFDVIDLSGFLRAEVVVAILVGGTLVALARPVSASRQERVHARTLVAGGALVAALPFTLLALAWIAREAWVRSWNALGQAEIASAHDEAWTVIGHPDTSISWYGAVGALVIIAGGAAAVVQRRRGGIGLTRLLSALAPVILVCVFALAVVYDPWRGRMLMFGLGLACAAWGWTLRIRWVATGVVVLSLTTVVLSLLHASTKPSGVGLLEPTGGSIWRDDRIEALTVIRDHDGTRELLRAVELGVPDGAELTVAAPLDTFLAPLAGPHLSRRLTLVAGGRPVSTQASWLVIREPARAEGCRNAWEISYENRHGWRLLRRIGPDDCRGRTSDLVRTR